MDEHEKEQLHAILFKYGPILTLGALVEGAIQAANEVEDEDEADKWSDVSDEFDNAVIEMPSVAFPI